MAWRIYFNTWGIEMGKLTPILETVKQILKEARKPLHVSDMADIAVRSNRNFQLEADALADRFAAALAANLNTKTPAHSLTTLSGHHRRCLLQTSQRAVGYPACLHRRALSNKGTYDPQAH